MNCKVLAALGLSALVAGPALAGLNPASPGLPIVLSANEAAYGADVPNNQISAMCVDCHTVAPRADDATTAASGSHYVHTAADGGTWSGGSGITSTGTIAGRDGGEYFKVSNWVTSTTPAQAWPSKYGNAYVSTVNQLPTGVTSMNATEATITVSMDLICESCHNIVGNADGGNNLLAVQPDNDFVNGPTAVICVGCHGFMYSNDTDVVTASAADNNIADARNTDEIGGGQKGNNEYHWVRGVAMPQNHHVMTGDSINATKAAAGALWTDNLIIAYATHDTDNTYAGGTLPQKDPWTGITKPSAATDLSCTSCHTPAHGFNGSPAGSILRNATYTGIAGGGANVVASRIERIITRGGWKKIDDLAYCTQCHIN